MNPLFPSDMVDAGYDVINHTAIDERYGTMEDFEGLVKAMHKKGLCWYIILLYPYIPKDSIQNVLVSQTSNCQKVSMVQVAIVPVTLCVSTGLWKDILPKELIISWLL